MKLPWGSSRAADKPAARVPDLVYALNEAAPPAVTFVMMLQHLIALSTYLVLPTLIIAEVGGTQVEAMQFVRMTMLVTGIATLLQCLPRGPVGSGYAVPQLAAPIFFGVSVLAAHEGGLALVQGMTLCAGIVMVLISGVLDRLRIVFPTEVIGVIVVLVGVNLMETSLQNILAIPDELMTSSRFEITGIAVLTFITMAIITARGGRLQRLGILIGAIVGISVSIAMGATDPDAGNVLASTPWIALPALPSTTSFAFRLDYLLPFLIAAVASTAKTVGDLTVFQKANDATWVRTDMMPLRRGIFASGLGNCVAGLLGSLGTGTATACIGISFATRIMSRNICITIGAAIILLSFFPLLAYLFVLLPTPVKGALVLFISCFIMLSGIQLITARMVDARRTFVVGASLAAGLGVAMDPELFNGLIPQFLASSLTLGTVTAVGLNILAYLSIKKSANFVLIPGPGAAEEIAAKMESLGGNWGARSDVIAKVTGALTELTELLASNNVKRLSLDIRFNEFSIVVKARFEGLSLDLPLEAPDTNLILDSEDGRFALSGYLIRRLCKKIKYETSEGKNTLELSFEH